MAKMTVTAASLLALADTIIAELRPPTRTAAWRAAAPAPVVAPARGRATHAKMDVPSASTAIYTSPKVYRMVPGFDRKLAKGQTASNGQVLAAVRDAGKTGIAAGEIAKVTGVNGKTVQSCVYQLRHMGLIASGPRA